MGGTVPAGAAGSGSIGTMAGVVLVIVLVVVAASVGPVRETVVAHARQLVSYFMGPGATVSATDKDESTEQQAPASTAPGRASERDSYDFDLSLLALGDAVEESKDA